MILILLAIFTISAIILRIFIEKNILTGNISLISFFICACAAAICLFVTVGLSVQCTSIKTYDAQIAVITEQNNCIEEEISTVVKSYEEYEKSVYASAKIDTKNVNFIALAEMYPELQSNELVQSQIELYKENNNELKKIKLAKAKASAKQWWLYFYPIGAIEQEASRNDTGKSD